jgi:uncharacterized repeat protein (TIGR03803 family)
MTDTGYHIFMRLTMSLAVFLFCATGQKGQWSGTPKQAPTNIHHLMKPTVTLRSILVSSLLAAAAPAAEAQVLYSTNEASDALFRFDVQTNTCNPLGSLTSVNLANPRGVLTHIGNGVLIGVSISAPMPYGAIYRTDTTTNTVTILHQFTNLTRSVTGFVMGNDGLLYTLGVNSTDGTTYAIYSFDPATNAYTQVFVFPGAGASQPLARLMKASNGLLYGVTDRGGSNNEGILFSYNTATSSFTSLYDFNTANGTRPLAALLQADNGKLYGVTSYGGANDKGVLFSFDPANNSYTKLHDFAQPTGQNPATALMQADNGLLYSTTMTGGSQGVLYSYDIAANTYTVLHAFFAGDGYSPRTEPIQAPNGILYGATTQGGANFQGSIYSFNIATSTFTKLFDGSNAVAGDFSAPFLSFDNLQIGIAETAIPVRSVAVYPNPATTVISLPETCPGCPYRITDALGRTVATGLVVDRTIPTADLDKGVYSVQISDGDEAVMQARFVKE